MTYQEVKLMLDEIGLPYAYYQFKEGTAEAPPFVCFFYPEIEDMYADNQNYQRITQLCIELYTKEKDFANEAKIETVLKEHGLTYTKEETYIDTELLFMQIYTMDVVITQ